VKNNSGFFLDVENDQRLSDAVNKLVAAEIATRVAVDTLYTEYKVRGSDPGDKLMMAETSAQSDRTDAIGKVVDAFNALCPQRSTRRGLDADAA
jgi:hypothetical protein